jgi:hypothetical protein
VSGVDELSGTALNGYRLGDRLGWTSHTAVYQARRHGAEWAVKVFDARLAPDAALSERLRGDAAVLAGAGLPDVVPIEEAGRSGRLTFAASPLVQAPSLRELMDRGPIDNERAWSILARLADALDGAHDRGIVCRALRPDHVLVDGEDVYLAEFAAASARVGQLALASPDYRLSEPQYLAPEQVKGREPDRRTDVYALAVLVFELLTSTRMRTAGAAADVLGASLTGEPPSAREREPSLPRGIDEVLGRGLARSPEERHGSAWDLLDDLVAVPDDASVHVVAGTAPVSGPPARAPGAVPLPVPVAPWSEAPRGEQPADSMVGVLGKMGLPVLRAHHDVMLNAYFAALVQSARRACQERWPAVAAASGLHQYAEDDPADDANRSAPVSAASRLAEGIEAVFGLEAMEVLGGWGRETTDSWIKRTQQLQEGEVTYMKPIRLRTTPEKKVEDALYVFTRNLDRVRGERLTAWKRLDKRQFWVVHYDNLTAIGRRRPARSCAFWTASLVQALRWAECANDWMVDEAECGCVTGTYDCVFTIRRVAH